MTQVNRITHLPRQYSLQSTVVRETPSRGELLHNFTYILWFSIRRATSYRDAPYIFLILVAPLLYLLKFRGVLKTPVGKLTIDRNDILRWSVYGLFKTRFYYTRMLESSIFRNISRSTILDVGANLGDFTMATSSKARKVISVEPGRKNFDMLSLNLRINSLNQVVPLNVAAHDSSENLSLKGNGADLRVANFNGGEQTKGEPLDSLLQTQGVDFVDVAKIDVQGHEMKVLGGMGRYLKEHRIGLVIVEVHPHRGISASDVASYILPFGYHLVATDYISGRPQMYFQ